MLGHGRQYGCDSWLPEDKNLICGMEGENVVAYGGLDPKNETLMTI